VCILSLLCVGCHLWFWRHLRNRFRFHNNARRLNRFSNRCMEQTRDSWQELQLARVHQCCWSIRGGGWRWDTFWNRSVLFHRQLNHEIWDLQGHFMESQTVRFGDSSSTTWDDLVRLAPCHPCCGNKNDCSKKWWCLTWCVERGSHEWERHALLRSACKVGHREKPGTIRLAAFVVGTGSGGLGTHGLVQQGSWHCWLGGAHLNRSYVLTQDWIGHQVVDSTRGQCSSHQGKPRRTEANMCDTRRTTWGPTCWALY